MKFRGCTDTEDFNIQTLAWMMCRRECWHGGVDWKDWRWRPIYTWYDGPMWHFFFGPFWLAITY